MSTTYPTKQAASKLNLTDNTIRNWSAIYGNFLSEQARPGNGSERRFTETDVTILEYIKQLKADGLREGDIKQRLSETSFAEQEVMAPSQLEVNDAALGVHEAEDAPLVAQNGPDSMAALITALDAINALRNDVETLKGAKVQNQRMLRDAVFVFMAGFVAALVLMLLVIVVVDLWVK